MVADKIRKAIEAKQLVFNQRAIPVTISSGVAQFMVHTEEVEATIARADEALYQAKANGRNRVYFHDGEKSCS